MIIVFSPCEIQQREHYILINETIELFYFERYIQVKMAILTDDVNT